MPNSCPPTSLFACPQPSTSDYAAGQNYVLDKGDLHRKLSSNSVFKHADFTYGDK